MSIFISHTHADKPIVEPIAIRLREIFGEENVFYDSWSIQPGESIIEKINQGLENVKFIFVFLSKNSIEREMVKLEWQNAIFKVTNGEAKIIPIRLDETSMPVVLTRNLYIDLFSNGLEAAITRIVQVIQGVSTFTPKFGKFSNLYYIIEERDQNHIAARIQASHYMEANLDFIVLCRNEQNEVDVEHSRGPSRGGFHENMTLDNGQSFNAWLFSPLGGSIQPGLSLGVTITLKQGESLNFFGIMHRKSDTRFEMLPEKPM